MHSAQVVSDAEQAWNAVHDPAFDPAGQVVIEADGASLPALTAATGKETVRWVARSNNELSLEVTTTAPGYLVLSEVWYPGWVAETEIDGRIERQPVLRANTTFRAIPLWESGTYQVRLRFAPKGWSVGVIASLATFLLLGVWGLVAWRRHRARASSRQLR